MNADTCGTSRKLVLKRAADLTNTIQQRFLVSASSSSGVTGSAPLQVEVQCHETAAIGDYVRTENEAFGKIVVGVSVLVSEVKALSGEAKIRFLDPVLLYSEDFVEVAPAVSTGKFVSFLQELVTYKARCKEVIDVFVKQLDALVEHSESASGIVPYALASLSELLACLIALDVVTKANNVLRDHWISYRSSVDGGLQNAGMLNRLQFARVELQELSTFLGEIDKEIFAGRIFPDCLDTLSSRAIGKKIVVHLTSFLHTAGTENGQTPDAAKNGLRLLGTGGLLVLHTALSRTVDKRLLRNFLDLCKMHPIVPVWKNIAVAPADTILALIPDGSKQVDKKQLQIIHVAKEGILQARLTGLQRDTVVLRTDVNSWVARLEEISSEAEPEVGDNMVEFLRLGLRLARKTQDTIVQIFHFHSVLLKPISKATVMQLGELLEVLMVNWEALNRHALFVCQVTHRVVSSIVSRFQSACQSIEKRLTTDEKRGSSAMLYQLDALTSLRIFRQVLSTGPLSEDRMIVARLCLGICMAAKKFPADQLAPVAHHFAILKEIRWLQQSFDTAFDTSIFYWNRRILRPYLESVYQNPVQATKLPSLLAALELGASSFRTARHEDSQVLVKKYQDEIMEELETCILRPLCKDVETSLRLLVHSHLSITERSLPEKQNEDLRHLISQAPFKLFDTFIDIRKHLERYLDRTFYDLTTVALHDWKTYDEMRSLASHLYGLNVLQAHLPCQTLEQGADILEIMRNIGMFVSAYAYNLNNQVFVERTSNNKYLNTIGIRHIANSLRTHGIGVVNTTINQTYQFLRKRFNLFSQFMFDEQIKSRLVKDIRLFKEAKQNDSFARYPFEKAEKFNKGIRALGVTADGQTKLDQLRTMITQIGNAMGFVRMVRSGGLHRSSKAFCFIPDAENVEYFEALIKDDNYASSLSAATALDEVVASSTKNSSDGMDFFKLLLNVFATEFRNQKNHHLQNFYIIIPPLMVNFVEHSVTCKERIQKKNSTGEVLFTDDGFAMGMAYIMALLDQTLLFDSLSWFESVREKFRKEQAVVVESAKAQPNGRSDAENDEKLRQALKLTSRRLDLYAREFDLLFHLFSSARIFFSNTSTAQNMPSKA